MPRPPPVITITLLITPPVCPVTVAVAGECNMPPAGPPTGVTNRRAEPFLSTVGGRLAREGHDGAAGRQGSRAVPADGDDRAGAGQGRLPGRRDRGDSAGRRD